MCIQRRWALQQVTKPPPSPLPCLPHAETEGLELLGQEERCQLRVHPHWQYHDCSCRPWQGHTALGRARTLFPVNIVKCRCVAILDDGARLRLPVWDAAMKLSQKIVMALNLQHMREAEFVSL